VAEAWEPASLGDERLDREHRETLRKLRALSAAVAAGSLDEVRATVRGLADSLTEHWHAEERWMEEAGYPGLSEHKRHHDTLLLRLADAVEPVLSEGPSRAALELAQKVEEHLRVEDLKLARFSAARRNFRAMAEALPGKGPVLTPVPGTLAPVDLGGGASPPGRTRTPEPGRLPAIAPPAKKP
jgi:hemerythrin-like metal-binding protein